MVLKRILPCLLFDGKGLVKTINFKNPNYIGDPINAIKIFNDKEVDELVLLDINASKDKREPNFEQIKTWATECFMPFSYGGGVSKLEHFYSLYRAGVEKVSVNSLLLDEPNLVKEAVKEYGSSSVIGSVDVKKNIWGKEVVFSKNSAKCKMTITEYCLYLCEEIGVGELLITSVSKEGTWSGYDIPLLKSISEKCSVPIIASGGAGSVSDIKKVLYELDINAAALGSMAVYQKKGMGVLINFPNRNEVITENYG